MHRRLRITAYLMGLSAGVLLSATAAEREQQGGLNLIPWPKSVTFEPGRVELTSGSRIVTGDAALLPLARILADELDRAMALKPAVVEGQPRPGDIVLTLDAKLESDEPIRTLRDRKVVSATAGAYLLTVGDTVAVAGYDYRAVAEGTSTLLQSLRKTERGASLPRLRIKDWPHADYVGTMLDVARQDHPAAAVRQVIDLCRLYRVRYLHLHLTDDQGWTFPSTAYPQLGSRNTAAHGGVAPRVYTLPELTELAAYADARGVTLVPELNLPGHSEAALRSFPEVFDAINPATGKPVNMGCMNMANEQLYEVLDTVIGEMCAVFKSSPYFHIGTDEVQLGRLQLYPGYKAFMEKHGLENDGALARHFVLQVNEMVARRGRKAIKWEGLADTASRDIIIMTWDDKSRKAEKYIAEGFTTITCPWVLGVPWEEWNMYICNGSRLKRTDAVLGSTLVMWEMAASEQVAILRERIPQRQERTWGPDNTFTADGWFRRHNATDALAGHLIGAEHAPKWPVAIDTTLPADGLQEPILAVDDSARTARSGGARRDGATWFLSARPPRAGDRFDLRFDPPLQVLDAEVITGAPGGSGILRGVMQLSSDGRTFPTSVAAGTNGVVRAEFADGATVHTLRLLVPDGQAEPLAVADVRLRELVEIDGVVSNPNQAIGAGKVALCTGDAGFDGWGRITVSVVNRGHDFVFRTGGGNALDLTGFLRGTGRINVAQGGGQPVTLGGGEPNTFQGTWRIHEGILRLAKPAGTSALAGTVVAGGGGKGVRIEWLAQDQVDDRAAIELGAAGGGTAFLALNGHSDAFASLGLAAGSRILTDDKANRGALRVERLVVDGEPVPTGVYGEGTPWLEGRGLVTVGTVARVEIAGDVAAPRETLKPGSIAVLTAPARLFFRGGTWNIPADTAKFDLAVENTDAPLRFEGLLCGEGGMDIRALAPVTFAGATAGACAGVTRLSGRIALEKQPGIPALSASVTLAAAADLPAELTWRADRQLAARAVVKVEGAGPALLDLGAHQEQIEKLTLTPSSRLKVERPGRLHLRQLLIGGEPVPPGIYDASLPWIEGSGTVEVDPRIDVSGLYTGPNNQIGVGNVANMVGDTTFGYCTGDTAIPIVNNGHKLTFDSGGGNPFRYAGVLSGTGEVFFRMGPGMTGYKDAPMRLGGSDPNTLQGRFHVKMGRVQLEKPDGVVAISGDVTVGGQGFNDCLFWKHDEQIADSAAIVLIESPNAGAAYLQLNGRTETVRALTVHGAGRVLTDGPDGKGGVLRVGVLHVDGKALPAGTYTAAAQAWIEGTGQVVVR